MQLNFSFDRDLLDTSIERTNLFYGGKTPDVRNVIFVNGDRDAWSKLSVLEHPDESVHTILIKGTVL